MLVLFGGVVTLAVLERRPDQINAARALVLMFGGMCLFGGFQIIRDTRRAIRDIRERIDHKERFELDEQGLTFWRDGEPQRLAWSELETAGRVHLNFYLFSRP